MHPDFSFNKYRVVPGTQKNKVGHTIREKVLFFGTGHRYKDTIILFTTYLLLCLLATTVLIRYVPRDTSQTNINHKESTW